MCMQVTFCYAMRKDIQVTEDRDTIPTKEEVIPSPFETIEGKLVVASVIPPGARGGRPDRYIVRLEKPPR